MRQPSASFIEEKNKEANEPIWLFRVNISDTPEVEGEEDLFLAQYNENVDFFKTDDNIDTPQSYMAIGGASHGGISTNMEGRIDSFTFQLGNVNREVSAYLANRDGLRGRKVTIRQVFINTLNDPDAYIEDIYYIDSVVENAEKVTFKLVSKFDLWGKKLPGRLFLPNCSDRVIYKGRGCWIDNGDGTYTEPLGFSINALNLYLPEVIDEGNTINAEAEFFPRAMYGFNQATDSLSIEIKPEELVHTLVGADNGIYVSSTLNYNVNALFFPITDYNAFFTSTAYTQYIIPFSQFTELGTFNPLTIQEVRLKLNLGEGENVDMRWRNARAIIQSPYGISSNPDTCLKTLDECIRHNNTSRYGGFPNIPRR